MKNPFIVRPTGLKGNEKLNRMRELMGATSLNENVKNSVVELTKLGPDGKVYGIVREGHNYFIKVTDKQSNIVTEDFNYIGGLMNKTSEAYPTYAKAIKQLNLKFMSLNEAYGKQGNFNTFEDDNLLSENEATKDILDKAGEKLSYDSKEGKEEGQFGDNVADKDVDDEFEKVKLSENEMAIDEMLVGESEIEKGKFTEWCKNHGFEGPNISCAKKAMTTDSTDAHKMATFYMNTVKPEGKTAADLEEGEDKNNPWAICTASVGRDDKEKFEKCVMDVKKQHNLKESKRGFSIESALEKMDSIIGEDVTDKVSDLLNSLTESEKEALLNTLKKKA